MKRIVSLLLVLVLCCTMLPQVILEADTATKTVYHQTDSPWGDYPYKYHDADETKLATIGSSGCALLALTNAVNYLTGSFLDPVMLAEFAISNGYRKSGSGTLRSFFAGYSKVKGSQYGYTFEGKTGTANDEKLIEHLKNGGVAVGHVKDHYIALVGYDTSSQKFHVYDSAPSAKRGTNTNDGDVWLSQSALTTGAMKLIWYGLLTSTCDHKYNDSGYCKNTGCGREYDYQSSMNTLEAGYYKVTTSSGIKMRTGPYQARSTTGGTITYGTQVRVIGSLKNHFENKWYQIEVNGIKGYTYESHLTLVKYLDQSITGTITDPVAGEQIPQGKHPVAGTITSHNYPLQEVKAYLDGSCYATVTLGKTNTLDVRSTDINAKLSFGSLSLGAHTLVIKARDIHHSTLSTVCTVTFTTVCGTHSYTSKVTKAATCAAAGVRTYTCSKCGDSYPETIPATGSHSYSGWVTVTGATCTANGTQKKSCSVCGNTQIQSIAATGHSYSGWTTVTAATCTAAGTQQKACYACGDTQYQVIPAIGYHSYGEWVTVTAPTCTENGTQKTTCTVCGDVQTQTVAATEHIYIGTDKIGATCTEFEKTCYTCMKCQDSYEEYTGNTYAAHNYQNGRCVHCQATDPDYVITDAVLQVESKTARAGSTVQVTVSLKNNPGFSAMNLAFIYDTDVFTLTNVENMVEEMTMTSQSAYIWDCAEDYMNSGELARLTFRVEEDAPKGEYPIHMILLGASNENLEDVPMSVVDGTITVSSVVYGDANGDGKVTTVDLSMLRKYMANIDPLTGLSSVSVNLGADANGDGKVSTIDLSMLRKYFANIDPLTGKSSVVLGPKK